MGGIEFVWSSVSVWCGGLLHAWNAGNGDQALRYYLFLNLE